MFEINSKSKIFFFSISAFLLGNIAFGITKNLNVVFLLALILALIFSLKSPQKSLIFLIFILLTTSGGLHFQSEFFGLKNQQQILSKLLNEKLSLEGKIVSDVAVKDGKQQFVVKSLVSARSNFSFEGIKFIVNAGAWPRYQYGEKIFLEGTLKFPSKADNGFDYESYLLSKGIVAIFYQPKIKVIDSGKMNVILLKIYENRRIFLDQIKKNFPEPEASLLAGLIIGDDSGFTDEVKEEFRQVGLSHILAVSGYNITVLAGFLIKIFKGRASRLQSALIVLLALSIFSLFTGAEPPVLRASVMSSIVILAALAGRLANVKNCLILSAFILTLFNPFLPSFDLSFKLSFLATCGLVYFADFLKTKLKFLPDFFTIRETCSMTLAANLTTFPLLIFDFRQVSLVFVFANLLILPFLSLAFSLGLAALVLNFFIPQLSLISSFPAYLILKGIVKSAGVLAALPFASLKLNQTMVGFLLFFWLILTIVVLKKKFHEIQSQKF